MRTLLLVDGHSLLYRAYHALPPLARPDGTPTGAVYGFVNMLMKAIEDTGPHQLLVAFDTPHPTFRHQAFDQYKAQRETAPDDFRVQVPLAKDLLERMNIPHIARDGFEADDIIGTLAIRAVKQGNAVLILTGDRDLLQLVRPGIDVLLTTKRGMSEVERLDGPRVLAKMGVDPTQIPDLKGLMGDASDNIPGVPGIGEKSARELLRRYKTIDELYASLDQVEQSRWKKALEGQRDRAVQSRDLATIRVDVDLEPIPETHQPYQIPRTTALRQFFRDMAFDSLARRIFGEVPTPQPTSSEFGLPLLPMDQWPTAEVVVVSPDDLGWKVAWSEGEGLWRGPLTPQPAQLLVGFGVKSWMMELPSDTASRILDAEVAAYLLDPSRSGYTIADLAELVGAEVVDGLPGLARIWPLVTMKLETLGLHELFTQVEMPLVAVLARMEKVGIRVDRNGLEELGQELDTGLSRLEREIHELAGLSFNINSPQQLGEVLFDKLQLPALKKTKTGYSTDAETLESLAPLHPMVEKVLTYRQLVKLKGTYVDGLKPLIDDQGRVHTHYNQTVTATGRLSSSDPNLQNIPIRMPLGRRIRRVFLPSPGRVLLAADYSQIELRLLAHFSGDPVLLQAFRDGEDIHQRTAAEIFSVPLDAVSDDLRNRAKAINFGIIYGISDFGLANNTGVSRHDAAQYIERYFSRYPLIKRFLDGAIETARKQGYVTTVLGRRRYLPEIHSPNRARRQYAERTAMNSVLQGSAADLIKVAMVKLDQALRERGLASDLVLQVHDELIWDLLPEEESVVMSLAIQIMTTAIALDVPLTVDLKRGTNWEAMDRVALAPGGPRVAGAS